MANEIHISQTEWSRALGKRLCRVRGSTGLRLNRAASNIGISKGQLSKLENGIGINPSVETLIKVGKFYGIKFVIP